MSAVVSWREWWPHDWFGFREITTRDVFGIAAIFWEYSGPSYAVLVSIEQTQAEIVKPQSFAGMLTSLARATVTVALLRSHTTGFSTPQMFSSFMGVSGGEALNVLGKPLQVRMSYRCCLDPSPKGYPAFVPFLFEYGIRREEGSDLRLIATKKSNTWS